MELSLQMILFCSQQEKSAILIHNVQFVQRIVHYIFLVMIHVPIPHSNWNQKLVIIDVFMDGIHI